MFRPRNLAALVLNPYGSKKRVAIIQMMFLKTAIISFHVFLNMVWIQVNDIVP